MIDEIVGKRILIPTQFTGIVTVETADLIDDTKLLLNWSKRQRHLIKICQIKNAEFIHDLWCKWVRENHRRFTNPPQLPRSI